MSSSTITQSPTRSFALERFAWGGPDRLELSGTFTGLGDPPAGPPVLVLTGGERTHRLPAAEGDVPEDGEPWSAAFVWEEPPAAFETAVLRLGADLTVELPEPGADGDGPRGVKLPVQGPAPGTERIRLEAELLAAREDVHEARAAQQRAEEELSRAREDLRAERDGRAADAARFREGLAEMHAAAEEALGARDAELADVRGELEVAVAFREEAEAASQAEIAALRERLDEVRRRLDTIRETLG
jgi:hypothetical protein